MIVAGCPVYNRGWILDQWFEALETHLRPDLYSFVYTPSNDDTLDVLEKWKAKVGRVEWVTYEEGTHGLGRDWSNRARVETLADMRNIILDRADLLEAVYVSVDSDIILAGRGFLYHLSEWDVVGPTVPLATDRTIINAFSHRRPDGWVVRAKPGHHGRVDVLCAVKAIRSEAVKQVRYSYHPRGEDFGFAESARQLGVTMGLCAEGASHHMTEGRPPIHPPPNGDWHE